MGKHCFVGATPPPIYSKTGQHLLEGYANRDCGSYASFEDRLIQAEADRPPKSENSQYLQRIEFDSQGRIGLTTACRLVLADGNAVAVESIRQRTAEGPVARFVFVNGTLRAIAEDQASANNVVDDYRAQALGGRAAQVYRIRKKPIGTQEWVL